MSPVSFNEFNDFSLIFYTLFPFSNNLYGYYDTLIFKVINIYLVLMSDIGLKIPAIFSIDNRKKCI